MYGAEGDEQTNGKKNLSHSSVCPLPYSYRVVTILVHSCISENRRQAEHGKIVLFYPKEPSKPSGYHERNSRVGCVAQPNSTRNHGKDQSVAVSSTIDYRRIQSRYPLHPSTLQRQVELIY